MELPIKREWMELNETKGENNIRILQWNILSDALSTSSPTSNFCAVSQDVLSWSKRGNEILSQIKLINADIICLQEVDHFDDLFVPGLSEHEGLFVPKIDSTCLKFSNNNGPDGVALFYRSSRFLLKEKFCEHLQEENGEKPRTGIIAAVLEDQITCKLIICVVVHLKAKIGFEFRRLAQSKSALNMLLFVLSKYPKTALVWCGDFNGESNEPYYELLMNSPLKITSSYSCILGKELDFTTWKIRPQYEEKRSIDYIWFTPELLSVKGLLLSMNESDVPKERFPCNTQPSDHIPLCIEINYL